MGSGEEEDDGGLPPTEDDDDVQRPSGPPESVSALVSRGYVYPNKSSGESQPPAAKVHSLFTAPSRPLHSSGGGVIL